MSAKRQVQIVEGQPPGAREAWVERLEHGRDEIRASLMLADGSYAVARPSALAAEWLGLRAGDIVAVTDELR